MPAPIVTGLIKNLLLDTSIAASELFTATDSDDAIVSYYVQDFQTNASSGYFTFDGVAVAQGSNFQVSANDLSKLRYVAGNQIGFEKMRIMARDAAGNLSNALTTATVYSVRANTTAPWARAKTFNLVANETIAATDIISGFDPDGYPIESYNIRDRSIDSGWFVLNGVAKAQGTYFTIAASELANLRYSALGSTAAEFYDVIAFDGALNSLRSVGVANTAVNANRPIVRYAQITIPGDQTLPVQNILDVADADGNSIKKYRFYNTSPHATHGELVFKGVIQPRLTWIEVQPNELDQMIFDAANRNGKQEIRVMAYDGKFWSPPNTLEINSTYVIPVVKPVQGCTEPVFVSEQLRSLPLNSLFTKLDAGPAFTKYEMFDPDVDPSRGYFALGGVPLQGGQIQPLTAAQYGASSFVTGAFYNRAVDTVYVRASNGSLWGDWKKVEIRTEPEIDDVLTGANPSTWNGLLPRNGLGQLVLTFSFMQQFPDYETGEARDGDPALNEHFTIFKAAQRENARLAFRHLETLVNVQMLEVADTSTNVFGGTGGIVRMGEYGVPAPESTAAAFAFFPGFGDPNGDMWFNRLNWPGPVNFVPGTWGYKVFLHEFGHAMGLKHPHDGTPRLPPETDVNDFSVMSYQQAQNGEPTTFQLYDISSLQGYYGANMSHRTGNDVYSLSGTWNGNQNVVETIWDAGGIDSLSAAGALRPAIVDLRSGQQSSIGNIPRNITIAFDAWIENASGSDLSDRLFGNSVANTLNGGLGNDILNGGTGNDVNIGGAGNDTFEFGVGDGFDIVNEMALGGLDTLRITSFPNLDALHDDFVFRKLGNDLVVDLRLNGGDSQGTVRIVNQALAGSQVETLNLNGVRIDLENLASQAVATDLKFKVLATSSANGFLVLPV